MRFLKNKKPKYFNVKTNVGAIKFDSKFEAQFYQQLLLQEKAGQLKIIALQPKVYLTDALILYKPDFLIRDGKELVWIDVKGMRTAVFQIKKRLWEHYGPGKLRIISRKTVEEVVRV